MNERPPRFAGLGWPGELPGSSVIVRIAKPRCGLIPPVYEIVDECFSTDLLELTNLTLDIMRKNGLSEIYGRHDDIGMEYMRSLRDQRQPFLHVRWSAESEDNKIDRFINLVKQHTILGQETLFGLSGTNIRQQLYMLDAMPIAPIGIKEAQYPAVAALGHALKQAMNYRPVSREEESVTHAGNPITGY